ncbi:MAG TPA: molybdopterin cofactor-binding domain-containing protein [Gammaproteobacteria bacterium]|jgi:isoquinoline 1-oxidoreductase beta subunit|nr:molybdopterin cofactor-binding domain-containing protein [Gammaproteobacteria bacterium]
MGITRRRLIYGGLAVGGGLIVYAGSRVLDTGGDGDARLKYGATTPDSHALNAWVKIAPDGRVTFAVHRAEMGQGITTSLPMLLAEEMDADWSRIDYEFGPVDKDYYNFGVMARGRPFGETEGRFFAELGTNLLRRVFHAQGMSLTLSSTSIIDAYDTLRPAGAAARAMLVAAAANRWGVPAERLITRASRVIDPTTKKSSGYGELAEDAALLEPPSDPPLKKREDYTLLGRSLPRLDVPDKVAGAAMFGSDVVLPDMLYATVVHSPVAGGAIGSFDASEAERAPGVEAVLELGNTALAVVADNTWAALSAAKRIRVEAAPIAAAVNSNTQAADYLDALGGPDPSLFREDGDALAVLQAEGTDVEAVYQWPYLAHACMEPMNCTALYEGDKLQVWVGSQALSVAQEVAAGVAGLEKSQVTMHRMLLGGGFGRRAEMDFVERAVATAMQLPGRPVKVIYSREEDMQNDMYRPAGVARVRGRVGDDGAISAIDFELVTQSVVASYAKRTKSPRPSNAASDQTVSTGIYNLFYTLPNMRLVFYPQDPHVPAGYWRSTSTSYGAFCVESFIDELAHHAQMDPVEFRLANLPTDSRQNTVLRAVADKAGWGQSMAANRYRGVALFEKAGNVIGQVAEITVSDDQTFTVDRIVCVMDSGQVFHPDTCIAMMEGGIVFGINAALFGEITLQDGVVQQSNFHNYRELPIAELPEIEVHLLPYGGRPSGVGETAVPGVAPAIANAIFAATGKRIRRLPIGQHLS